MQLAPALLGGAVVGVAVLVAEVSFAWNLNKRERRAQLGGKDSLRDIGLQGVDLRGLYLAHKDLSGAILTSARLDNANLQGATLAGTQFDNADLNGANLYAATLAFRSFEAPAGPQRKMWPDFSDADLRGAVLDASRVEGADFTEAKMHNVTARFARFSTVEYVKGGAPVVLRPTFKRADLRDADLAGAVFEGADFERASLRGADLRHAKFQAVRTDDGTVIRCDLRLADLHGAKLHGCDLRGAELPPRTAEQDCVFKDEATLWPHAGGGQVARTIRDPSQTTTAWRARFLT